MSTPIKPANLETAAIRFSLVAASILNRRSRDPGGHRALRHRRSPPTHRRLRYALRSVRRIRDGGRNGLAMGGHVPSDSASQIAPGQAEACPTLRPCRKQYSPRRHGDTEKNKVKGKTGAHGGHGAVKSPRSEESSLRAKISAASNTKLYFALNKFANRRYAPGTPAGNWRNQEYAVKM